MPVKLVSQWPLDVLEEALRVSSETLNRWRKPDLKGKRKLCVGPHEEHNENFWISGMGMGVEL